MYIHTPLHPFNNLPPKESDQLCQCVIKSRTVKSSRKCIYSNSFQMHEQRGTFNGLDTCSVTNYGKFDSSSILLQQVQDLSLYGRPDLNAHLSVLVTEKAVSQYTAKNIRENSKATMENLCLVKYCKGSTFVPQDIAIDLKSENLIEEANFIEDNNILVGESRTKGFRPLWPKHCYPCQIYDAYGCQFSTIPALTLTKKHNRIPIEKVRFTWEMSTLLVVTPKLWKILSQSELRSSRCHGWMLVFLTRKSFQKLKKRQQDQRDPFKKNQVNNSCQIISKLENETYDSVFTDFEAILHIRTISLLSSRDPTKHKIIIISNVSLHNDDNVILDLRDYELTGLISTYEITTNRNTTCKFDGEVYCRHGGHHSGWWYKKRNMKRFIHSRFPEVFCHSKKYTLVYCKKEIIDHKSLKHDFLKYLGGKSHILCRKHNLPMIASTSRNQKCKCGKKEYFCCSDVTCNCRICKVCADSMEENRINFVDCEAENDDDVAAEIRVNDDDNSIGSEDYDWEDVDENYYEENEHNIEKKKSDYVTDSNEDIHNEDINDSDDESDDEFEVLFPTTNATDCGVEVYEDNALRRNQVYVTGHVIMNQCGSLLASRKNCTMKPSSVQQNFIHRICSTSFGRSIPLLYPEATLFPSVFYKSSTDGAILGAIPATILSEDITHFGFATLKDHIVTRLTTMSSLTSTNPRYIAHSYDCLVNLAANHCDTRVILNRGMIVDEKSKHGLGLRGKNDNKLIESMDSKQIVRNLCASMSYLPKDYFLTFTCNQKQHFGVSKIKNWLDEEEWKKNYNNFESLTWWQKKEIEEAILQSSSSLFLRNWQETCLLFLKYLTTSTSSPFKKIKSVFLRNEYQKDIGNLSHIHMIIQIDWDLLNPDEVKEVKDLIRANVMDIVRPGTSFLNFPDIF